MDPFVKVGAINRYIVFFSWILLVRCVNAQSFANIAVLLNSPQISNSLNSTITVFKFSNQSVQFDKAKFLGGQLAEQRLMLTENDPAYYGTIEKHNSSEKLIMETSLPVNQRFGIYTITISEGSDTEQLRVVLLNQDPPITPVEYSTVVVRGQEAQVSVSTSVEQSTLRWRRDGRFCRSDPNDCTCFQVTSCTVPTSELSDSFVMESFIGGGYSKNTNHAIMNVIIRECDFNHWGTDCAKECPRCFNGGICSDKHGTCICPPGFSGRHCETVRGRNVFGQNGEFRCDERAADDATSCRGSQICYPNPFGCTCPAGYSGLGCMTECSNNKFGADCKQDCHCADGSDCASDTGVCSNDLCAEGFKGVNCQVKNPCHNGTYGELCTLPCSCSPDDDCQEVEDTCESGCAETWTGTACDNNVQIVPMPTSASKPKESSSTEIIELLRTSKITQTSENYNRWTSFWIITVAVVVILLLVLGSVGLLCYRSRRQKGGVARPDKPENNGTDVRGNQLVNHHGDGNDEMVYNGDPKYYSIEDGEVKIPTYALPDQEMFNNRDSYEPVGKKAAIKSKKTLKTDPFKNIQHTNKSFEQIDKTKGVVENASGKMVDEASMRDEHEYSKTIFTEKKEAVVFCDRGPQYINYKITGHTSIRKA